MSVFFISFTHINVEFCCLFVLPVPSCASALCGSLVLTVKPQTGHSDLSAISPQRVTRFKRIKELIWVICIFIGVN